MEGQMALFEAEFARHPVNWHCRDCYEPTIVQIIAADHRSGYHQALPHRLCPACHADHPA